MIAIDLAYTPATELIPQIRSKALARLRETVGVALAS